MPHVLKILRMINARRIVFILWYTVFLCNALHLKRHNFIEDVNINFAQMENNDNIKLDNSTLEYVTVLFRHGERTPTFLYPTYPNPDETFYPVGLGELTNLGKKTEYNIGKFLRERYDNFLGTIVEKNTVKAVSSDISRTKASLMLVLASLYPPNIKQKWDSTLNWQPIPFSYNNKLFVSMFCPEQREWFATLFNAVDKSEFADLFSYLEIKTGIKNFSFLNGMELFYNLDSLVKMNLPLPDWSENVFPQALEKVVVQCYHIFAFDELGKKYGAGYLLQEFLDDFKGHINKTSPKERKISLYSGHETNIALLQIVLGVYNNEAPPFGAFMIMELHNIDGKYGVKVLYQDYKSSDLKVKVLPNCSELCPLEVLDNLLRNKPDEEKIII